MHTTVVSLLPSLCRGKQLPQDRCKLSMASRKQPAAQLHVLTPELAPLMLIDMLHMVPSMFVTMPADVRKVLLTTSSAFCKHIHDTATELTAHKEEIPLLLRGNWMALERLTLTDGHCGQNKAPAFGWHQLSWASWSCLTRLSLSDCQVGATAVGHLVKGDWPHLESLDLSNNHLTVSCISLLTTAKWPQLSRLDLSKCKPDGAATAKLVHGNWLCLQELCLSHNQLDVAALGVLAEGNWPVLKGLYLAGNNIGGPGHLQVLDLPWPGLEHLDLSNNSCKQPSRSFHWGKGLLPAILQAQWVQLRHLGLCDQKHEIDAHAMSWLSKGDWPNLTHLSLNESVHYEDASESMAHLVQGSWPQLKVLRLLSLFGYSDTASCMHWDEAEILSRGLWPQLRHLDLSGNGMNGKCVLMVTKGQWPMLQVLKLRGNLLNSKKDIARLVQGEWPMLWELDLSCNSAKVEFDAVAADVRVKQAFPLLQFVNGRMWMERE